MKVPFSSSLLLVCSNSLLATKAFSFPLQSVERNGHNRSVLSSSSFQHRNHFLSKENNNDRAKSTHLGLSINGGEINGERRREKDFSAKVKSLQKFVDKNSFLLGMFVSVFLAKIAPQLGMDNGILKANLWIGNYGVFFIFLLSGLGLQFQEIKEAISSFRLNFYTQAISFLIWPLLFGLPLTKLLKFLGSVIPTLTIQQPLLDGLFVTTALPTTINMCVLLTNQAGGNVATSLCNAVLGNFLGIFITPAILYKYFKIFSPASTSAIKLPFQQLILKLTKKVVLPVAIGQVMRQLPLIKKFYTTNKKVFKQLQETVLLGIVWNAFSNTFGKGVTGLDISSAFCLLITLILLNLLSTLSIFSFTKRLFNGKPEEVVASTLCSSHKTLAFGLPLIKTIFEGSENLAYYCAPIMFVHPLQLILGSLIYVPEFKYFIDSDGGSLILGKKGKKAVGNEKENKH